MSKDELTREEIEEIIAWALGTGAIAIQLSMMEDPENDEEVQAKIDALDYGVNTIIDHIPAVMYERCEAIAEETASEVWQEEQLVQRFKNELDEL